MEVAQTIEYGHTVDQHNRIIPESKSEACKRKPWKRIRLLVNNTLMIMLIDEQGVCLYITKHKLLNDAMYNHDNGKGSFRSFSSQPRSSWVYKGRNITI